VWYHLGLSYYFTGAFGKAAASFAKGVTLAKNGKEIVQMSDWRWLSAKRAGDDAEAARALEPIRADLDVDAKVPYFRRLKVYKGLEPPYDPIAEAEAAGRGAGGFVTPGYGIAWYHKFHGDEKKWADLLDAIANADVGPHYYQFAYIAALVDKGLLK